MAKYPRHNSRLHRIRVERGLTQSQLAERLGVDTKTVQRWAQGIHMPRPYARLLLSKVLESTPNELGFGEQEWPAEKVENAPSHASFATHEWKCSLSCLLLILAVCFFLLFLMFVLLRSA